MKKKNASVYIIAFTLFCAGVGWLAYAGFSEGSRYFLTVSEARAAGQEQLRQARLFGTVAPDGIIKQPPALAFNLADKDSPALVIPVDYKGMAPDGFKPGAEVIVEGGMGSDGRFRAKMLMTKCPSKYQKENRAGKI